ncbi:MAG: flagellar MS-ring protein [Firmicutes bacterium ADurb.Bin419]|nr:MAG: flagellar MS-ring protein [Firmicutes bacterium ADurb.Bin419]
MKLKVKEELERNIKVLYPNKSSSFDYISVVVNPVLEFDKQKSTKKEVLKPTDIDEAVVSSHTEKEELVNGTTGGVPGTDTNPGDGTTTYPIEAGDNSSYKKTTTDINREFNEIMTEMEKAQGTVNFEQSSVAVTLWYGQRVADDSAITPEFLEQCQQVISGATNIPVSKISINKYKLAPEEVYEEPLSDKIQEYIDNYGYFALMLTLIIGLLIAVIPRKKKESAEESLSPELAANGPQFIVPEEPLAEISFEERSEVKKQIEKFVKEKPESVAQLLRNWLSDDWD